MVLQVFLVHPYFPISCFTLLYFIFLQQVPFMYKLLGVCLHVSKGIRYPLHGFPVIPDVFTSTQK